MSGGQLPAGETHAGVASLGSSREQVSTNNHVLNSFFLKKFLEGKGADLEI